MITQVEDRASIFAENYTTKVETYLNQAAKESELISRSLSLMIGDKDNADALIESVLLQDYPVNSFAIIASSEITTSDSLDNSKLDDSEFPIQYFPPQNSYIPKCMILILCSFTKE